MQPFPTQFSIGPIHIAPATVLAPMAGVTDTVFRRFIRNLGGCGLIMTEFTSSHGVSASMGARKPTKTLKKYLAFEPEEHPISAQLFGADPYPLGISQNKKMLDVLFQASHEEGLTKKLKRIEDIFDKTTLDT